MSKNTNCQVSLHREYDDFGEYTEVTFNFGTFGRFTDVLPDDAVLVVYVLDTEHNHLIRLDEFGNRVAVLKPET